MPTEERWYSIDGRITRMTWVTRVFGGGLAMVLAVGALTAFLPRGRGDDGMADLFLFPVLGLALGFLLFRFIQDIKRLHDLGKPGVYVVCAFIPLVNLIYVCFLIFADGQPHPNEYGADPHGRGEDIDSVADVFR